MTASQGNDCYTQEILAELEHNFYLIRFFSFCIDKECKQCQNETVCTGYCGSHNLPSSETETVIVDYFKIVLVEILWSFI